MSLFVTFEDFVNKFELTLNDESEIKINSYIERYENQCLIS
jgi:hypothetical protein